MKNMTRATRTMAAVISLALIHSSFGPAAWAQVTTAANGASGQAGSAAGASVNSVSPVAALPASAVMPLSAAPSLGSFAAPSFAAPAAASPAVALAAPVAASRAAAPAALSAAPARAAAPALAASPVRAASTPEQASAAQAAPAAPALSESAAASISENGPRTKSVSARVSRRFAELKSFFGGKSAQTTPAESAAPAAMAGVETNEPTLAAHAHLQAATPKDGDKVAQSGGDNAPPAPTAPQTPGDDGKDGKKTSKGALFGLGLAGFSIIGYMLAMQVGLEAQGVAMPQLTENAFKDFTLLPLVSVFASIGSMIGQPMAKFFIDHLGMSKTFYAAHALRAISLGTMVVLFGTGMMSMPLMMGFYLLNGMVTGIASTAEGTLRKLILAEKGVSMQSFRTWWQLLAETLAVPAPIFFGAMVHTLGALGAPIVTAVYPVTILLGLILAYVLKIYPLKDVKKASDAAAQATQAANAADPSAPAAKKGVWAGVKAAAAKIFANMEAGKNYVMSMPYLKYSLGAAAVFDMFNVIIYRLLAPGYGKMTGGEAGLSAVQGNLVGMFSLGGLLLSIVFLTLESRAKAKAKKAPQTPEAAAAAERSSMLRWMFAGIPALGLLATMAFHMALPLAPLLIGGTNYMPASLFAAALIPFGFFQVAASIKLNSYFQEKLPQDADKVQKALAFSGSVMTALSIVTMLAMRPLFSAVTVFNPFPYMAMALVPVAAGLFFLMRKLAKATTPEAIAAAESAGEPGASKNQGAYVGLILGIVAAAVVITALPMIPGVGAFIAGLGVMGKFLLNLGLTIALPLASMLYARSKNKKK